MRRGGGRSSGSSEVHFSVVCVALVTVLLAVVGVVGEDVLLIVKSEDWDFEDEIEDGRSGGVGREYPCRRVVVRAVLTSVECKGTGRIESARA